MLELRTQLENYIESNSKRQQSTTYLISKVYDIHTA